MPYRTTAELPKNVTQALPPHAQEIYKEAFNSTWNEYKDPGKRRDGASREVVAHRVAWNAVKEKYERVESSDWRVK